MDAQARKIIGRVWASGAAADRQDPEAVGLTRTEGWPVSYEQVGTGAEPERTVFNQRLRELDAVFAERMQYGGTPPYDPEIDYYQWARTIGSDGLKYVALVANGPAHGNAIAPTDEDAGEIWRIY